MSHLVFLILAWQAPTVSPGANNPEAAVWQEIISLETFIEDTVARDNSYFTISSQSPARGFYVERRGVILMVPVRYRPKIRTQTAVITDQATAPQELSKLEIQKRLKAWQDELRRQRTNREANFEKVVANLTKAIPDIVKILQNLPGDEPLTIIIEERIPVWAYPGFSLNKNPSTKVVTLTIDNKDAISRVQANKTELRADWNKKVKRTNTDRRLAF
ncbi:MAG: hypothetical protein QNK37_18975 [Acidobacteriota bacterium]|nr:hypothetical protein [Acidobacteriota bacterium]